MEAKTAYILKRLEIIEQEIAEMKKRLLAPSKKKEVTLEGIWEGLTVTDEEIEEAKRSLFKGAYDENI